MQLEKCGGRPCPFCGCGQTRFLRSVTWTRVERTEVPGQIRELGHVEREQHACEHCGRKFWAGENAAEDGAPIYRVMRCPACDSASTRVTSTRRPVRYHRCEDCGRNFKSVEA